MPTKNQLAEQWSCQHLTASCRGRDISLAPSIKARASHQERTASWRADSVTSGSGTPTIPPQSGQSRALLIHSPPTQLRNTLFNASAAWMHSLLNSVSKLRNIPFPVLLDTVLLNFPSSCGPLKVAMGVHVIPDPKAPAVLPRKILDARHTVKTHHLQIQWCTAFLHVPWVARRWNCNKHLLLKLKPVKSCMNVAYRLQLWSQNIIPWTEKKRLHLSWRSCCVYEKGQRCRTMGLGVYWAQCLRLLFSSISYTK